MLTSELSIHMEHTEIKILMQELFFCFSHRQTPLHNHIYPELHFIEQGHCDIYVDNTCIHATPGDVLAIPPTVYHNYTNASPDLRHCAFQCTRPLTVYQQIHLSTRMLSEILDAITQYRRTGQRIRLIGYLTLLCSYFMDDLPQPIAQIEDRELLIYEFFSKQYNKEISLSDLADLLNLSKKQAERMVEKYTGLSFRAEITHQRMQAARQLMKNPALSLSEIAARVGYRSYSGFWKAFRSFPIK